MFYRPNMFDPNTTESTITRFAKRTRSFVPSQDYKRALLPCQNTIRTDLNRSLPFSVFPFHPCPHLLANAVVKS